MTNPLQYVVNERTRSRRSSTALNRRPVARADARAAWEALNRDFLNTRHNMREQAYRNIDLFLRAKYAVRLDELWRKAFLDAE